MQLKTKKKINEITERRRYKYKYIIGKKTKNSWIINGRTIKLIYILYFVKIFQQRKQIYEAFVNIYSLYGAKS